MKNQMDDKIFLRTLEEKDAEELFRRMLYNRNHLWPWINEMECLSEKHLRLQILSAAADYRSKQGMETGVFQENELIGMISFQMLSNVESEKMGEIGYWIDRDCSGRGVMTKALKHFINLVFDYFDVDELCIRTDIHNQKAQNLALRTGFIKKEMKKNGARVHKNYIHVQYFKYTRKEWENDYRQDEDDH